MDSKPTQPGLSQANILALQDAMARGELSARQLVLRYLACIAQFDQNEGGLNAVLEVNPEALWIVDALDTERAHWASGASPKSWRQRRERQVDKKAESSIILPYAPVAELAYAAG